MSVTKRTAAQMIAAVKPIKAERGGDDVAGYGATLHVAARGTVRPRRDLRTRQRRRPHVGHLAEQGVELSTSAGDVCH